MEFRDVGLLAVVIVGGLAIGWAFGDGGAAPSPTEAPPATAQGSSSASSQFGDAPAPGAAAMPPLAGRTTEGEQLDSAVQARAQAAFQPGTDATAGAAPANLPVMAPPPPAQSGSSWGGQSAASGSGWGGQGGSSGWGVQAGAAPASPAQAPTPAQPAAAPATTEQQPTE